MKEGTLTWAFPLVFILKRLIATFYRVNGHCSPTMEQGYEWGVEKAQAAEGDGCRQGQEALGHARA